MALALPSLASTPAYVFTTPSLFGFCMLQRTYANFPNNHGVIVQIHALWQTHHHQSLLAFSMSCLFRFSLLLLLLYSVLPSFAVKFNLQAYRWPQKKCFWNPAHDNTLVIVTANIGPGPNQRTDIEIIDSSPQQNVYLRKKGIKAETRLAITTHAEGEVGVCFYNYLEQGQCSILHHALRVMAF